ncbi:unnamed protein product, partial [Brassica oleracea]
GTSWVKSNSLPKTIVSGTGAGAPSRTTFGSVSSCSRGCRRSQEK